MAIDIWDTSLPWKEHEPLNKTGKWISNKKRNLYLNTTNSTSNLPSGNNNPENNTSNNTDVFTQISYKEVFKSKTTSPFSTEGNIINNVFNNTNHGANTKFVPSIWSPAQIEDKYNDEKNFHSETEKVHAWRSNYLEENEQIDDKKRLILLDWIMEVCTMMGFKRRTYHWSVVWIDLVLSRTENLEISQLQLVGVTCWIIAAKNEEIVIPCIDKFALSTASAYSKEEIISCEKQTLAKLGWKIQYPTILDWGNYVMFKWDLFISHRKTWVNDRLNWPLFRNKESEDVYWLRNYFLILDAISLDYYSIFISEKIVSVCIVYLLTGLSCNCFKIENILAFFSKGELGETYYSFILIFSDFWENVLNISQEELLNILKYVSQFFNICFDYTSPPYKGKTFEENVQMQTHNDKNVESLKRIFESRDSQI